MSTDGVQGQGRSNVPNLDGAIVTGGGQNERVGERPFHIRHPRLVAGPERRIGYRRRLRPRLGMDPHVPQPNDAVGMGRCHHVGIVTPSQGRYNSRSVESEYAVLPFEVVDLERVVPAAGDELGTIRSVRVGHAANVGCMGLPRYQWSHLLYFDGRGRCRRRLLLLLRCLVVGTATANATARRWDLPYRQIAIPITTGHDSPTRRLPHQRHRADGVGMSTTEHGMQCQLLLVHVMHHQSLIDGPRRNQTPTRPTAAGSSIIGQRGNALDRPSMSAGGTELGNPTLITAKGSNGTIGRTSEKHVVGFGSRSSISSGAAAARRRHGRDPIGQLLAVAVCGRGPRGGEVVDPDGGFQAQSLAAGGCLDARAQ
mmetsp:Transcript_27463/g.64402  ORF Transcript_27463/g.64402 Transcript_27463/m.64402 type:complete len:369 (+) Transcript_27463:173-1279(+)